MLVIHVFAIALIIEYSKGTAIRAVRKGQSPFLVSNFRKFPKNLRAEGYPFSRKAKGAKRVSLLRAEGRKGSLTLSLEEKIAFPRFSKGVRVPFLKQGVHCVIAPTVHLVFWRTSLKQ